MRLLRLGVLALAVAFPLACSAGGTSLKDALRQMVLQPQDLPEGLQRGDGSFTHNEDVAGASADPAARLATLEGWGRLLGFEIAYQPSDETPAALPVRGINVSSSLYEREDGAAESFEDAVKTAEETDWPANYGGLRKFRQEEVEAAGLADEIVWLRLSGFQPTPDGDELVTDDLIFFQEGRERGFLRVLAGTRETEDPGHYQRTVEGWLRTLVGRVQEALAQLEEEQ